MTKTIGLFILILIIFAASCNNQSILVDIDVPEQASISLEKQVFLKITPEFENFIFSKVWYSSNWNYKRYVLYFLITVSIFGLLVFVFVRNYIKNKIEILVKEEKEKKSK